MSRAEPPPGRAEAAEHEPAHRRGAGAILVAGLAAALSAAMISIPREHAALPAVARYAMEVALPRWGLTEPVNEVVYGTRGFDTFGETFLLLAAVVSVVVITRSRERRRGYFGESLAGRREQAQAEPATASERAARAAEQREQGQGEQGHGEQGQGEQGHGEQGHGEQGQRADPVTPDDTPLGAGAPETAAAMTVVVRTAIRIALPVLAVAGFYLVAWGYSPGGGFPAGAVLLGVLLLAYAGFGHRQISKIVRPGLLEAVEMSGAAAIIATEVLGLVLRGSVSANWLPLAMPQTPLSGGIAQLFSASELIEVGTGLAIAVFALIGMGHDWAPDAASGSDGEGDPQ